MGCTKLDILDADRILHLLMNESQSFDEGTADAARQYRKIKFEKNIVAPPSYLYRGYTGHVTECIPDFAGMNVHVGHSNKETACGNRSNLETVNMNGRLYDPLVGRMLSVDNYIADGSSTQAYNRYSYALNNPLKYTDPDGELPFLAVIGIAAIANTIAQSYQGNTNTSGGFWKAAAIGAAQGAATFGVGSAAGALAAPAIAGGAGWGAGSVAAFQVGSHAVIGGATSAAQGGNFWHGAAAGGISSGVASGIGALTPYPIPALQIAGGGLSGGLSSVAVGGNFWQGFQQGLITSGLNHAVHNFASGRSFKHLFKPDAIGVGINGAAVAGVHGIDAEVGRIKILRGTDKGKTFSVLDLGIAAGLDASVGLKGTAFYYTGNKNNFNAELFRGSRFEVNFGGNVKGAFGISGSYSRAKVSGGYINGFGLSFNISAWPFKFGGNINAGSLQINPFTQDLSPY